MRLGPAGCLVLALATAAASLAAPHPAGADHRDSARARIDLLRHGEDELRAGHPAAALDEFERAAMMSHAPDAEMGLVRAAMQDGQYRRALAFCAHIAGGHLEAPEAGAMYAWLLRMGGQPDLANRTLEQTRVRAPNNPVVRAVAAAFGNGLPIATGVLLKPPHRLAPWPTNWGGPPTPPTSASVISGAVLVGGGTRALLPSQGLAGRSGLLWVRNGLGQTTAATIEPDAPLATRGLTLLRLHHALPGDLDAAAAREPFAGSPGYLMQFARGDADSLNWPWLRQGFFGGHEGGEGARQLGFEASPEGLSGGVVLDARGGLAGVQWLGPDGSARWWPESVWRGLVAARARPSDPSAGASAVPRDAAPGLVAPAAIYEAGLRIALRVLASD